MVYYFKVEPIKWRILSENNGTALILCESIIASRRYSELSDLSNIYKDSEIRAWLNSEFYNTAFNSLQQNIIEITNVDNSAESTGDSDNGYYCENTSDKIFLPSYNEMIVTSYGFVGDFVVYDEARRRVASDYSRAMGAIMYSNVLYTNSGWWWLRSPHGYTASLAYYISNDGDISRIGHIELEEYGVVPALRIKLL
jgi:hypothetical protein